MIDAKVFSSARKIYSEATHYMSKLAKKIRELEKRPVEKDNVIDRNKEKRSTKKSAQNVKRKEQLVNVNQGSDTRANF